MNLAHVRTKSMKSTLTLEYLRLEIDSDNEPFERNNGLYLSIHE
jgi:hypothetical protein